MSTSQATAQSPNYVELARFLLQPFLDAPDALKVDAEFSHARSRVLIRVAFDETEDRGRVFGRGGRNIKAITTTIEGIAKASGQSARLEVFGVGRNYESSGQTNDDHDRRPSRRSNHARPTPKPKKS
jgi:hypothetical protein